MGAGALRRLLGTGLASLITLQSQGTGLGTAGFPATLASYSPLVGAVEPAPAEPVAALEPAAIEPVEGPAEPELPTPRLRPCTGELGLIGTVVNERDPELSRVLVRLPGGAALASLRGRISSYVVATIEAAGVLLRGDDGVLCTLPDRARAAEALPEPAPPEENEEPIPRGKPVFDAQELADGLKRIGEDEYLVQRSFLRKALTNPGGSAGGAWFRPAELDGQHTGMEVLGIRSGTALDAMGIRNGDVIRTLNGISFDALEGVMSALKTARESDHIALALVRAGQPRDVRFHVE